MALTAPLRLTCIGVLVAVTLVLSGCAISADARAARDLAGTVKVQGFRWVDTSYRADTILLYFAGHPPGDLTDAVSARGWTPTASSPGADLGTYTRVASGDANYKNHACVVDVDVLQRKYPTVASELNKQDQQAVADGALLYVRVA